MLSTFILSGCGGCISQTKTNEDMIIEQPAMWLRWLYPRATWRMNRNERAVYLTFDDGPIPEATPFILKTLEEFNAHATFFMVGDNVRKHPELYKMIVDAGHQVGNHTFNHWGGVRHTTKSYSKNVEKANELIKAHLFRPPHGWMRWSQYFYVGKKYRIVMWDLVTRDYSKWMTADDVVNNVKQYTRNGSIITFHDSLKSIDKLRTALPEALRWLREQGYEFKTFE
jgi:peptidoglycan-N-acetylglucosamine deacetylase